MTASTKTIKLKLEATIPLGAIEPKPVPPMPPFADHWPDKTSCSGCASCGTCGKKGPSTADGMTSPMLHHAVTILLNILSGKLTPEQINGALDLVDQLLRRHYSGDLEEQGKG